MPFYINRYVKKIFNFLILYFVIFFYFQLETVQLLLQNGSNVNLRDSDGDTPLLLASRSGQIDMVRLLLDNGNFYVYVYVYMFICL